MDRLYRLIEFNEMQMQLLERATTLMGRELTTETRDGWMRDFQQLRAALLAPQIARLLHRSSIPELPIVFNVVVVGEPGVGKSTLLKRLSGQNDHLRVYIQTGTPEPHLIVHRRRNAVPGPGTRASSFRPGRCIITNIRLRPRCACSEMMGFGYETVETTRDLA